MMISIAEDVPQDRQVVPQEEAAGTGIPEERGPVADHPTAHPATARDVVPPPDVAQPGFSEFARRRLGWGRRFFPEIEDREARASFANICQQILCELEDLEQSDCLADGKVTEEGAGFVAQVDNLLESLFDCPFGQGESLKGVVVAIQSQTKNVDWTEDVVSFLREAMVFLRARYAVNDQTIDELYEIIKGHGLNPFRGTVSDEGIKTQYRLVRVDES